MGSIPQDLRNVIAEQVRHWTCPAIAVGCSGNFTVERVIRGAGVAVPLAGNDVTIYSCTIGRWLAGERPRLAVRPAHVDQWGWLAPYLAADDPASTVATVMLSTAMLQGFRSPAPYYARLRAAYRARWPDLHRRMMAKLAASDLRLAGFAAGDVVDWFATLPAEHGVICFPPFFARDYAEMFAALEELYDWDAPAYTEFDERRYRRLMELMREHRHWIIANNVRRPAMEPYLRGIVQTTNRGLPVYIYSRGEQRRIVRPAQEVASPLIPHLIAGMALGDRIALAELTGPQFAALRSVYMNHNVRPGTPTLAVAVLVDGLLVGCFAFSQPNGALNFDTHVARPHVYMLSDFPVGGSDYPRLSKLIVMAAVSVEAQRLAQRMLSRRVRSLVTTAFTDQPVSMKYRGVYRLLTRKELKPGEDPIKDHRYQINYGSAMGRWTLAEALAQWKAKYGHRRPA